MDEFRSYEDRAKLAKNDCAAYLLRLMARKRTNLAVACDVTNAADLLSLANLLGPFICVLKTHIDILNDFTPEVMAQLRDLAQRHDFLLFEDRKFADIGNTVIQQYCDGIYKIASWAHLVDAHVLPGPSIIEALSRAAQPYKESNHPRGLLLLAEMSSKGHLMTDAYKQQTVEMAKNSGSFVTGFIAQSRTFLHGSQDDPGFIIMTPGISLVSTGDQLGQQYKTPQMAITGDGVDVIIVGRGIISAEDPVSTAIQYRDEAWSAYEQRMK